MQQRPLRSRLFLLAVVGILPLAMLSGFGLYALIDNQQKQAERTSLDLVRAIGVAVDGELRRTASGLELLATAPSLDTGDMAAFEVSARRALVEEPHWQSLVLSDANGRVLLDIMRPGSSRPTPPSVIPRVSPGTADGAVGNLARDGDGTYMFGVGVVISRSEAPRFTLTAATSPEGIRQVLDMQRIPDQWVVSIFDAAGFRVARSRAHERFLGKEAAPSLKKLMAPGSPEGSGVTYALEGDLVLTSYTKLTRSAWTAAIGIAPAALAAPTYSSLLAYGGGILLSIALGMLAAFFVARSITRPIRSLRDAAQSLGRGEPPQPQQSAIREINEVAVALVDSAQARAQVESEREDLLGAERQARTVAEEARRRLELRASAGATLSRYLEPEATLQAIAQIIVPAISDWCRVDLIGADGKLHRALTHHRDPEKTQVGIELVGRLRAAPETPGSMAWTVATGQSHLARFSPPKEFDSIRDRDLLQFAQIIGMRAYFIVPLTARGRTLGALAALQAESDRELSADDCALITELAQRAALALDNARLFAEAEAALREADRANRSKDEFLAMLGHELRNPLAPIVTALHLMSRKSPDSDVAERRIIERQVAHLSRLVDDLLDVSRITRGKIQLEQERVDIRSVVERSLELTQPLLDIRSRPIDVDVPDEPIHVLGDAVRLTQVICNLLTNAIKFTAPDGRIALGVTGAGESVVITVSDAGRGIGAELLPHVFDLFVQGRQSLDRHSGGLGLGLAIVRTMVQMHGGTVEAKSDGPGHGSTFVVTLPTAAASSAPDPIRIAHERRTGTRASIARILVVDDNADAAETLAAMLKMSGHESRTAPDAESALAMLADFLPDIAILDIGLPGIDGYELARRLEDDPRTRHVRLIALTGYGREPDRRRALSASFEEHLVKPVAPDQLLDIIAAMLEPEHHAARG